MDPDEFLFQLSAAQHGFVTRQAARTAGLSKDAIRHRVRRCDWVPHGRRLLHRQGSPWTAAAPLMRAVLDAGPGAVVSGTTAAAWWGLPGFDLRTIHVTRPRGVTGAPATYADVLHEVLDLSTDQVTVLDGIPVARPERVIFDLCAFAHPRRAERAMDAAWTRNLCSGLSLRRIHDELAGRGRGGTCVMRELLEARPPGWIPPASNLEARFMAVAADHDLGRYRRQIDLGADEWCGRVDFLHERLPLVVEVQSERYHTALTDVVADARRRRRLEAAGFVVAEVWDRELWHDPAAVVRTVRQGAADARRRLAA